MEEKGNFGHVHLKSLLDVKMKVLHVGFVLKRQISVTLGLEQVSCRQSWDSTQARNLDINS